MKKVILTLLFVPALSFAASASLILDTQKQSINTLEATIHIPYGVSVDKIDDGNSVLLIWLEHPTIDKVARTITFTGLTPGGFNGLRPVFNISGNFAAGDIPNFFISNVTALLNDGKGTRTSVTLSLSKAETTMDETPPEPFLPVVSYSAEVFDSEAFLSFLTQDKQSGVIKYEYAATRILLPSESDWQVVESPFLIPKGDASKELYVRATDRAGNTQISSVMGPKRKLWFGEWGIIIVFIVCVLYFRRRFF